MLWLHHRFVFHARQKSVYCCRTATDKYCHARTFERSNTFNVDFENFREKEYSFPLPVGKATLENNNSILHIETKKGDAVKAMFDGYVRLSRKTVNYGNVIVIRHDNGLETVYAFNAENLVKVGQGVEAGQTIAIVGGKGSDVFCEFSVMVNGARINPETVIELKSHRLRRQTMQFRKTGNRISVTVVGGKVSSSDKKDREFTRSGRGGRSLPEV